MLIPARNEARGIARCVESVLVSTDVELEVVVLDDHSADRTAEIVREIAAKDSRVRLEVAPPLPAGWCGKQHACFVLAGHARHDVFSFLDADVRLTPDALARMVGFLRSSGAGLVSGFPRQETGTFVERLVIPLINWILVCYLPIGRMRKSPDPAFRAGCGQWFTTTRDAYEKAGTHAAVRESLHDGVTLPRAYRRAGMLTDICDTTNLAVCRMYRSGSQVWFGLAKNAREGLGEWPLILVWTGLLFGGHVLPWVLLAVGLIDFGFAAPFGRYYFPSPETESALRWAWVKPSVAAMACGLSLLPRLHAAYRFRASWLGAVQHPFGVSLLLAIQWYATVRHLLGLPAVGWKGRPHPGLSSGGGPISP
ncbi:MAG: glycosyltransferase family 2 protein [Fimbriiglobus sp.]